MTDSQQRVLDNRNSSEQQSDSSPDSPNINGNTPTKKKRTGPKRRKVTHGKKIKNAVREK